MEIETLVINGIAQGGPLAVVLAWFMLRAESRLEKVAASAERVEQAIDRLSEKIGEFNKRRAARVLAS